MPSNYSPGTPVDKFGNPKHGYPPAEPALASSTRENALASSILLLTHNTTEIHVAAVGSVNGANNGFGILGKWLTQTVVDSSVAGTSVISGVGVANYDFVVQAGEVGRFVVPVATFKQSSGSVMGVNRELGLYPAVALRSLAGTGSVLTLEF